MQNASRRIRQIEQFVFHLRCRLCEHASLMIRTLCCKLTPTLQWVHPILRLRRCVLQTGTGMCRMWFTIPIKTLGSLTHMSHELWRLRLWLWLYWEEELEQEV